MIADKKFVIEDVRRNVKMSFSNISPFVKKRMYKDGHMVDELQQYLRTMKPFIDSETKKKYMLGVYNRHWAIAGIEKDWNDGKAVLNIEWME